MTPPPQTPAFPVSAQLHVSPRRHPILMPMSFAIYTLIAVSLPYYVAPYGTQRLSVLERQTPPKRPEEKHRPKPGHEREDPTDDDARTRRSHPQEQTKSSIPCPSTLPFAP